MTGGDSFAERVERVREALERVPAELVDELPVGYVDQCLAASHEAHDELNLMQTPWAALLGQPLKRSDQFDAGLVAGLCVALTESSVRPHLRRGGPQPGWHVLERRRLACRRCMATSVRAVVPVDCCDLCRQPAERFTEFAVQVGPVLHLGDAGSCCASKDATGSITFMAGPRS